MDASGIDVPPTPTETKLKGNWFTERFTPHELHRHELKRTLVQKQTAFQHAILADSYAFGRCLILDGEMQSARLDEFIYHECLVQPAMVLHPKPQDILILGGGEGATAREVLRHPHIRQVTMVDIDQEVVAFCRAHLQDWHQGALDHAKTRLIIADARRFVLETSERFDIIISDLPTPAPGSPVGDLYTADFYRQLLKRLRPNGLFAAQAGSGSLLQLQFHAVMARTLRQVFKVVRPFYAFVPSFDVPWAFLVCSQQADPQRLSSRAVDARLGSMGRRLRFYDGQTHVGLFHVPKYIRSILQRERRIMTARKSV